MDFQGIIIDESLVDKLVLDDVRIVSTKVELVTKNHRTPWVKQWTMHEVKVDSKGAEQVAERISKALDSKHQWYADFKTDKEHYIIYRDKVFHVTNRSDKMQYEAATKYGISLGIPDYQVDFSPHISQWNR